MRVVVVASADLDPSDGSWLDGADQVIAADGGAASLDRIGRRPDRLIGDLDSVEPSLAARLADAGVRVERHPPDKDASDTELAVEAALEAGATEVVLLGAFGGSRIDHELANLLLLADAALAGRDIRAVRGGSVVRAVHGGGRAELRGAVGDIVTLLPIGSDATGVTTDGLRWPLDVGHAPARAVTRPLERGRGQSRIGFDRARHAPRHRDSPRGEVMTTPTTRQGGWRIVDIVVAAAVAVAFGVVFLAWNGLAAATLPLFAFLPPAQAIMNGLWLLPAVLVGLIVRRPGAAFFGGLVSAAVSVLLGSPYGADALVSGAIQGAGAELGFAIGLYRGWTLPFAILAGALSGLFATVHDVLVYYPDADAAVWAVYGVASVVSGALVAGVGAWLLLRALVGTGVLRDFAAGREQREV